MNRHQFSSFSVDQESEINNYFVTFNAPTREIKSFRDELRHALLHKANVCNKPICAMFSGGVDSQSLLITLREQKIPFVAVHLAARFNGKYISERDIEQCKIFAKQHNFVVEYHDIDIELNQHYLMPSFNIMRYKSPYIKSHAIIGLGGNNFHYSHNNINYYDARSYIHNETSYWILDEFGYDFDFGFYQYTPELYFSFLFHPVSTMNHSFLKVNPHLPHASSRLLKFNILYSEYGDELMYFQKRSGMEDYPPEVTAYDDEIWKINGYDTWVTFSENELRSLYNKETKSITKSSTVNPIILRHIKPKQNLLRI